MGIVHAVCGTLLLTMFLNTDFFTVVPGANDNLTGAIGAIAVAKHLCADATTALTNTELVVLISGSEEAGLRGAKAFAESHRAELVASGVETAFLELETLREIEHLSIADRDMNGLVRQDPRIVKLVSRAAVMELGHDIRRQSVYCGATDAAAIAQIGVAAVSLEGMNPGPARYYHTTLDHPGNMSVECISAALRITARAAVLFDLEGLGPVASAPPVIVTVPAVSSPASSPAATSEVKIIDVEIMPPATRMAISPPLHSTESTALVVRTAEISPISVANI
jgi:hypothetical protein